METAASFEARNAPSSYPTPLVLEASRDQCLTKVTHYRRNQGVLRLHSPTPPLSMPVLLRRAIRRSQDSLHQATSAVRMLWLRTSPPLRESPGRVAVFDTA